MIYLTDDGTMDVEQTTCRTVPRRRYSTDNGHCQDCGALRTTTVIFWVNGMRYRVCSTCVRAYRRVILKPCSWHNTLA